jgi:hypothetical protein
MHEPPAILETDIGVVAGSTDLFVKRHAACGGPLLLDVPPLPAGPGFRLVIACRCGDTLEEWVNGAAVPRRVLESRLSGTSAA